MRVVRRPLGPVCGKRGQQPQSPQQMDSVAQLPKASQHFLSELLHTMMAQAASR